MVIMEKTTTEDINEYDLEPKNASALYEQIAMGGPGLIAIIQLSDLKLLFVNSIFEHYLGYNNSDIETSDIYFSEIIEHYLYERLLYQLNISKESIEARSRYVIYHLTAKDGTKKPFYLYAAPFDKNNNKFYLTLHPDLSRWHSPYTSFNTSELFLEHFNSDAFGTFEWILSTDKIFMSDGLYNIYELDNYQQQINNELYASFIHPDNKDRVAIATGHAIASGEDMSIEYKIITAQKNVKRVHALARAIRNKDGKAIKFAGSIRDITEQKRIEDDLENKVRELHHSNKELEEFAYVASHDMQEPLRKITTFSDRLTERYKDVLTGDGAMYLSRIVASAENMRSLINDLLDFSRITKTMLPYETVNLNVVLREVKSELELVIEETGTTFDTHTLPTLDAVPSQMKQVFNNIISNAIKFHKQDVAPVITIETHLLSDEDKRQFELPQNIVYQKIQITDNGIGFENEYATRIFQVFQRLHGKSEYPGSGIGLAICKKILEYHNGIIFAENVPDKGARFTFILPQHQYKNKNTNL